MRLIFPFEEINGPDDGGPGSARAGGTDLAALRSYAERLAGEMSEAFPFRFGAVAVEAGTPAVGPHAAEEPALSPEDQAYRDAYRICWPGASNPGAVAATLAKHSAALTRSLRDTRAVRDHPALQAIAAQLAMLHGITALGPPEGVYEAVQQRAAALGLGTGSGGPGKPGQVSGLTVEPVQPPVRSGEDTGLVAERYRVTGPGGGAPVRADVLADGSYRLVRQPPEGEQAIADDLFMRVTIAVDAHRAYNGHSGEWRPLGDREMRLALRASPVPLDENQTRRFLERCYGDARRDGGRWFVHVHDQDTVPNAFPWLAAAQGHGRGGPGRPAAAATRAARRTRDPGGSPPSPAGR